MKTFLKRNFRHAALLVLLAVFAYELYNTPAPYWWTYVLGPLLASAWKGIMLLPAETKVSIVVILTVTVVLVKLLRRWWLQLLLAIGVLTLMPGVGFASAVQILFWALPLLLALRVVYAIYSWIFPAGPVETRRREPQFK